VTYVFAALAGLAFGMADQYLGSRPTVGAWAATVSMMAAPWFVVPFMAGITQDGARRAMASGLVVTVAALVGYFAMTCSPIENVALQRFPTCFVTIVRAPYNPLWIAGGVVIAPLYGFLGQRWRAARSWISAALVVGALWLEPPARFVAGMLAPPRLVWWTEIAVGTVVAASFAFVIATAARAREASVVADES
jgi:hypothetical protein